MDGTILLRYMAAWVRLHSVSSVNEWTERDLIDSFAVLPSPKVSFQEFARLNGQVPTPSQVTDDERMERSMMLGKKLVSLASRLSPDAEKVLEDELDVQRKKLEDAGKSPAVATGHAG